MDQIALRCSVPLESDLGRVSMMSWRRAGSGGVQSPKADVWKHLTEAALGYSMSIFGTSLLDAGAGYKTPHGICMIG